MTASAGGVGMLFEGKVVFDKTYGEVTYGCAACCAYKPALIRLYYNPLGIPIASQTDQDVEGWDTCSDLWEYLTLDFYGTWATGNTGIATVDAVGTHTGVAVGSTTTYTGPPDEQVQTLWNKCPIMPVGPQGGDNVFSAHLSCTPSSVTRGSTATCAASAQVPSGTSPVFSNWKFTYGTNTVNGSSSSSTWSGTMVTSGTVSVTVSLNTGGSGVTISANVTVNPRTGFGFTAVQPAEVLSNTLPCYSGNVTLPSPPVPGGRLGVSCLTNAWSFTDTAISDGGPNNGYWYVQSASASGGGYNTSFQFAVVSDLRDSTSAFYQAQCGNYNASTNPSGYISGGQLQQNTYDHEDGAVDSHYTEYVTAQNQTSNNIGDVLEVEVGPPSDSQSQFESKVNGDATTANNTIQTAVAVEPCGGNVEYDSSQKCAFFGNINYTPYASCQ